MARARNIKPSLFKNEVLGVADPILTILFQSLWCLADREGRLEDRPLRIKAETFPYREGLDINGYLTELERLEFIERYVVDGLAIIQVINFSKHQNPHKTEKDSELPKKPIKSNGCSLTVKDTLNNGTSRADSLLLIPDSLNIDSLKDTRADALDDGFDEFWNYYPKKVGKDKAKTEWNKKKPKIDDVLNALKWQKDSEQWDKGFIPNPATYLSQGRWKDEPTMTGVPF
jgi:hypothetical protein